MQKLLWYYYVWFKNKLSLKILLQIAFILSFISSHGISVSRNPDYLKIHSPVLPVNIQIQMTNIPNKNHYNISVTPTPVQGLLPEYGSLSAVQPPLYLESSHLAYTLTRLNTSLAGFNFDQIFNAK